VVDEGLDQVPYMARLEEELSLVCTKGFAGYFNMVRDYTMAYRSGTWSQYVKKAARVRSRCCWVPVGGRWEAHWWAI
jgi:hypothetical protein